MSINCHIFIIAIVLLIYLFALPYNEWYRVLRASANQTSSLVSSHLSCLSHNLIPNQVRLESSAYSSAHLLLAIAGWRDLWGGEVKVITAETLYRHFGDILIKTQVVDSRTSSFFPVHLSICTEFLSLKNSSGMEQVPLSFSGCCFSHLFAV